MSPYLGARQGCHHQVVGASQGNFMRIGLIGVGRIGVSHASTLRGLPGVDSLEAFYVAEACELSRHRQRPVPVAEVRR
jgi:hypothetical protein